MMISEGYAFNRNILHILKFDLSQLQEDIDDPVVVASPSNRD
jgi:hypothetical protein